MRKSFWLASAVFLSACGSLGVGGLEQRLLNRGPVALSSENPYLAANLLVAKKAKESPTLRGFLTYSGVPPAIEIEDDFFGPLRMTFYYPAKQQSFLLEETGASWIINGPFPLTEEEISDLRLLTQHLTREPILLLGSQPERIIPPHDAAPPPPPAPTPTPTLAPAPPPPAAAVRRPKPAAAKTPARKRPSPAATPQLEDELKDVVTELQDREGPAPMAELSPQGDVVHYVTFEGETLSMISRWYTHDRANVGRLIRLNRIKDPDHLQIGDVVVVPSYLVKNKTRLSEQAVRKLAVKR